MKLFYLRSKDTLKMDTQKSLEDVLNLKRLRAIVEKLAFEDEPKKDLKVEASMFECPICMDTMWYPMLLPCSHTYCLRCTVKMSETSGSCCPECRQNFALNTLTKNRYAHNLITEVMGNVPEKVRTTYSMFDDVSDEMVELMPVLVDICETLDEDLKEIDIWNLDMTELLQMMTTMRNNLRNLEEPFTTMNILDCFNVGSQYFIIVLGGDCNWISDENSAVFQIGDYMIFILKTTDSDDDSDDDEPDDDSDDDSDDDFDDDEPEDSDEEVQIEPFFNWFDDDSDEDEEVLRNVRRANTSRFVRPSYLS